MNNIAIKKITDKLPKGVAKTAVKSGILFGVFILSLLLARTALFGKFTPFGLGFAAGLGGALSSVASLGAAVGYFFPAVGGGIAYSAAAVLIAGVRFVISDKVRYTATAPFAAILGFSAAAVSAVPALVVSFSMELLLIKLAECLISACTAACVCTAERVIFNRDKQAALPQREAVCIAYLAGLVLCAVGFVKIGQVTLAGLAAAILVLCAAVGGKSISGAATGAILGFFLCAGGVCEAWCAAALAIGGLLAGILSEMGEIGGIIAFITGSAVYALMSGTDRFGLIYDALAGSLIFLIIPRKIKSEIAQIFAPPAEMPRLDGMRKAVAMRLGFASKSLGDISDTVERISARLDDIDRPPLEKVIPSIEDKVCVDCSMRCYCWEENRDKTVAEIIKLVRGESDKSISGCGRVYNLNKTARAVYEQYETKEAAASRIREVRELMGDQYAGIADLLNEVAAEFEKERSFDIKAAGRIESALRSVDIIPSDIGCLVDKYGRMTVEIRVPYHDRARFNRKTILREVSLACSREFEPPIISSAGGRGTLITLAEQARLKADTAIASINFGSNKLCGDTAKIFNDGRGHLIMLLSDGMGTGGRAAIDSALTVDLLERLIKAGFGYDSALRIVNSSLLYKSASESLATVDICSIDLFTGKTKLYKAGACPTVILRSGRTATAECASLPIGILRDVAFDTAAVSLSKGDIIVIFSDGVSAEGTKWIFDEVLTFDGSTASQLADRIADSAKRRRTDGHDDDITVAVAIIE